MIDFENVSKTYPNGTHALRNVNLHIDKGEFVFIVGASGAGKSTFLKLIMKEEAATTGEITINGNKLSKLKKRNVPYLRRHMGIVFQDFRLIDKMNVFDNVAFAMRAVGENNATVNKRVPYVLDLVGLKDKMHDKPSELSGGEQQRVSLARALVNNPAIIVADEPTGNIDPELSYEIIDLLTQINAMGTTVLVVTHEHELVREFNQRVITIDRGEIISDSLSGAQKRSIDESFDDYAEDFRDSYTDGYDGRAETYEDINGQTEEDYEDIYERAAAYEDIYEEQEESPYADIYAEAGEDEALYYVDPEVEKAPDDGEKEKSTGSRRYKGAHFASDNAK